MSRWNKGTERMAGSSVPERSECTEHGRSVACWRRRQQRNGGQMKIFSSKQSNILKNVRARILSLAARCRGEISAERISEIIFGVCTKTKEWRAGPGEGAAGERTKWHCFGGVSLAFLERRYQTQTRAERVNIHRKSFQRFPPYFHIFRCLRSVSSESAA